MCGIVGLVGKMDHGREKLFKHLLYVDAFRGWDSTGVFTVEPIAGEMNYYKNAVPAAEFIKSPKLSSYLKHKDVAWIGHNRARTIGVKKSENAHPFMHKSIVGVHNGTLQQGWAHQLDGAQFDVDSEAFFHRLGHDGLDEAIAYTHGDYAFVWYDQDTHKLNLIRNEGRPLYYGFTENKENMVIVSEPMFYAVARGYTRAVRDEMKLTHKDMFKPVPVDTLMTIELPDSNTFELTEDMLDKRPLKGGTKYRSYQSAHFPRCQQVSYKPQKKEEKKKESATILPFKTEKSDVKSIIESFRVRSSKRFANNEYTDFLCRMMIPEGEKGYKEWRNKVIIELENVYDELTSDYNKPEDTMETKEAQSFIALLHQQRYLGDLLLTSTGEIWDNVYNYTAEELYEHENQFAILTEVKKETEQKKP